MIRNETTEMTTPLALSSGHDVYGYTFDDVYGYTFDDVYGYTFA